jgi:hypothetical protein
MSRSYTSSPPQASPWHVEGLLYFFFTLNVPFNSLVPDYFHCSSLPNAEGAVFVSKIKLFSQSETKLFIYFSRVCMKLVFDQ